MYTARGDESVHMFHHKWGLWQLKGSEVLFDKLIA